MTGIEANLHFDPKYVEHLTKLLEFGFEDHFEVRMQLADAEYDSHSAFSALLKRNCLRESESMIVRKYGRKTEREFTLFGVVVQGGTLNVDDASPAPDVEEEGNVRTKLLQMVDTLVVMDNAMSGRAANEVFIDPIALYLDVRARTSKIS